MKVERARRKVDRPFKNRRFLRVRELIDGEVKHAWIVNMTDDGGVNYAEWHGGEGVPWIQDSVDPSWDLRLAHDARSAV